MKKEDKKNIKEKKKNNILIYFILVIALLFLYSKYIEPYNLRVNEYKIENEYLPKSFDGIKIVHFSDVHLGSTVDIKYLNKIVNMINKQKPDIVVFTGDMLDKRRTLNNEETESVKKALSKIKSNLGNYAVSGNHDIKQLDRFKKIMDTNFTILDNEEKLIYYKENNPISLVGLSDSSETKINYDILEKENNYYRFILCHEPDEYKKISNYSFNVMLSGHSHGGQVKIPLIGKIYTPVGAKTYYDNYYKLDNKEIFVSNGIGTTRIDIRFNSEPSINLYRLYAQN